MFSLAVLSVLLALAVRAEFEFSNGKILTGNDVGDNEEDERRTFKYCQPSKDRTKLSCYCYSDSEVN